MQKSLKQPNGLTPLWKLYDLLDLADWIFVALSVASFLYTTPEFYAILVEMAEDFGPMLPTFRTLASFPIQGTALYVLSLVITSSAIAVALKINKSETDKNRKIRRVWRWLSWAIWIPIDLMFIILSLA